MMILRTCKPMNSNPKIVVGFSEIVTNQSLTKRALDVTPNILEIKMEVQDK